MIKPYFANLPPAEIGQEIKDRVDSYYRFLVGSPMYRRQLRCYAYYYGTSFNNAGNAHEIVSGGKAGQLSMMRVNHIRNLGQHILQLTTSNKPAPQPVATNSDAKSQEQVTLAHGILEYYSREKRIPRALVSAAENSLIFSEGYVRSGWDETIGDVLGLKQDGLSEQSEGDVKIDSVLPVDVIKDPVKQDNRTSEWICIRNWLPRHEVIARYSTGDNETGDNDIYSAIESAPTKNEMINRYGLGLFYIQNNVPYMENDDIAVYEFFHKRTVACREGKYVILLEDGTVLYSGNLPYRDVPVRRIAPGDLAGTPFGYSPLHDLLAIQQAVDALYSAIATNQMTFGVQMIMAMKGSDLDFKQLARGLSFIEYNDAAGKPEPLNLTSTPAEVFKFIEQLERAMETISGINSVVRGNPEASLRSGSSLALVQAQAITFASGLQESFANLTEDVYTDVLNIIKSFAKNERTITIVGRNNRPMMKSFVGESITSINRVVVDSGSALSQTVAGKTQIAQDLLQSGLIKHGEEYISVINTGRLEPMIEGDNSELILIKQENENMADGKPAVAMPTDEHVLHIKEHRCVSSSQESRNNPAIMQSLTEHIMEHINFLADPALAPMLTSLGQVPFGQPPQDQETAPGQPAGGGAGGGKKTTPPPSSIQAAEAAQPDYPTNPETGQKWNPQDGGLAGPGDKPPSQPQ